MRIKISAPVRKKIASFTAFIGALSIICALLPVEIARANALDGTLGGEWTELKLDGRSDWREIDLNDDGSLIAAISKEAVYVSRDYGASWNATQFGHTVSDVSVQGNGQSIGVAAQAVIHYSNDYGQTWQSRSNTAYKNSIYCKEVPINCDNPILGGQHSSLADSSIMLSGTVGRGGVIVTREYLLWQDAYRTWQKYFASSSNRFSFAAKNAQTLATVNTGTLRIFRRINEVDSKVWIPLYTGPTNTGNWTSLDMSDDGQTIVGGAWKTVGVGTTEHSLYISTNGGASFLTNKSTKLNNLAISADGTVLVGENDGRISISRDNGVTWQSPASPADGEDALFASSYDSSNLYSLVDSEGTLLYSGDQGRSFRKIETPAAFRYYDIACDADCRMVLLSYYGRDGKVQLYKTADGGQNWGTLSSFQKLLSGDDPQIAISQTGKVITVGTRRLVFVSTDHGSTWTEHDLEGSRPLLSEDDGRIVIASDNSIQVSDDFGSTWETKSFVDSQNFHATYSNGNLLATGLNSIYSSSDFGSTWQAKLNASSAGVRFGILSASSNGTTLVVSDNTNQINISTNGGDTWSTLQALTGLSGAFDVNHKTWLNSDGSRIILTGDSGIPKAYQSNAGLFPTPKISGNAIVGDRLSAVSGFWHPEYEISYQWLRNGSEIQGAQASTFVVTASELSASISVRVTGRRAGYLDVARISQTALVQAGTITLTSVPSISGAPKVGSILSVSSGLWQAGVSLSYQWLRDGYEIPSAQATTYVPTPSDLSSSISVRVVGRRSGYGDVAVLSQAYLIQLGTIPLSQRPSIVGTPKVGSPISVSIGPIDADSFVSYQWLRDQNPLRGKVDRMFTPTIEDAGKKVSVRVIVRKTGYESIDLDGGWRTIPLLSMTKASTPIISGTPKVGKTLRVISSTWAPNAKNYYQWYLDGRKLSGAVKSTLTITKAHVKKKITVSVKQVAKGYATKELMSKPLKVS